MELEEVLSRPDGPEKTAALVVWIQGLFVDEDQIPVLVGGGAVEILTGGAYTTGDLDFVGFVPAAVGTILERSGFKKIGRHWIHEEGQVFVEFPGESLGPNERSIRRVAYGCDVVLVSIEDLLVDRLGAWDYWKSGVDGANALLLYRRCRPEIDEKRLQSRAIQEGFETALDSLRAFDAKWAVTEPNLESLEEWANRGPTMEDG